jgi:pilus assembly protein CpaF
LPAARAQVAAAIDLVVALDRAEQGRRRVAGLLAVTPGAAGAEVEEVWSCS